MRRPVINIMVEPNGLSFIEVCLPPNTWTEEDEEGNKTQKEEIPQVGIFPSKTHIMVQMYSYHGKPRLRYKPTPSSFKYFDDLAFGYWTWDLFWEGVQIYVRQAKVSKVLREMEAEG